MHAKLYAPFRTHARTHARRQRRNLERVCNTRRHRNPTDVQHVYVSPATLTLQFMRALTARRALPTPHNRPSVLPRLTGSLNTTANSPTRLNVQVQSPREVLPNRLPFAVYFQLSYRKREGGRDAIYISTLFALFPCGVPSIHL